MNARQPIYRDARDARLSAQVVANRTGRTAYALLSAHGELSVSDAVKPGWRELHRASPQFA